MRRGDPNRPKRPWLEVLVFFVLGCLSILITFAIVEPGMSGFGRIVFYLLLGAIIASCYGMIAALYYAFGVDQAEPPNAEPTRLDLEEHRGRHAKTFGWRRDGPTERDDD